MWLCVDRRRGAIFLVVFWRFSLGIVSIWKFDLVNAGENHSWPCKLDNIALYTLVHLLQFTDLSLKVRRVSQTRG